MDKNNQKEKIKDKPIQDKEDEKLIDEELEKVSGGIRGITRKANELELE